MSFKRISLLLSSSLGLSALGAYQWDKWKVNEIRKNLINEAKVLGSMPLTIDEKIIRVPLIYWTLNPMKRRELKGIWRDYFEAIFSAAGIDYEWILGDSALLEKEFVSNALADIPTLSKEEIEKVKPFTKDRWISLLPNLLKGNQGDVAVFIEGEDAAKYTNSIIESFNNKIKPSKNITLGAPLITFDQSTMDDIRKMFLDDNVEVISLNVEYLLDDPSFFAKCVRFFYVRDWYEKSASKCLENLKKIK